ncbi:MAG TPA: patatin-like phospholipase family protein [Gammaproteobacteria bacterium]
MKGYRSASLLAAAVFLAAGPALGQPDEEAGRSCAPIGHEGPSVGLVLSGGGARGGAHVGVLRALEELRVPVDCIAGTSIGAVVGGFYASGMSVEDIQQVARSIDWDAAFLNFTPREYRSFRRKRDDDLFLVNQRPGLNEGEFELPIGLVQGQVIDMILSRVTAPAAGVEDFDRLAVPFRAVAADIVTGEAVILGSGDLTRAVRASMSLPAALTPIELDGRLLVDGGIAMNLPVEVAKDMGADVVIAVDISSALLPRESISSVLNITSQLTNLLTRHGVEEQRALLDEDDVLLVPEFDDELTSATFERLVEAFQNGYEAVMEHRDELEPLALDEAAYREHVDSRHDPRWDEPPVVEFVSLDNDSGIADSIIRARLDGIEIGQPLDVAAVEDAIGRVYGLEFFQNVRYDVVEENGRTGLLVDVDERSWGPNYLQLGMEYSSSSDADETFGLAVSYLRTLVNPLGGEWRATFVIGDEPAVLADFYQPLGSEGRWFLEPQLNFQSTLFNVFEEEQLAAEFDIREAAVEIAGGRVLEDWLEVRGGVRLATGDYEFRVGDRSLLPGDEFQRGHFFARVMADTLDSVAFPTSGLLASVEWRGSRPDALNADEDFDQVLLETSYAKTWGRHTLLSSVRYDATISGDAPVSALFRMGGLFDLSGLNRNQLSGQHAARIGASYYRRIGDLALFPAFAGISMELGNVWDDRDAMRLDDAIFGFSLWAGVNTPIGPVYVGIARADDGQTAAYVSLGRVF